jgi:tRNA(Ile)-lysidine synthase
MDALNCDLSKINRVFLGISGGLDSVVLLHCLACENNLILLHVNHHLQPNSDEWEAFVQTLAEKYKLPFIIHHIDTKPAPAESIEAFARRERYAFFESCLEKGDALLLAHHQNDEVETFFLNLSRGAGLSGLSSMPEQRPLGKGVLIRPFLEYSRAELLAYAQKENLAWKEDPSNQDLRYDRNFLRHEILPVINRRWPDFNARVADTLRHLKTTREAMDFLIEKTLQDLCSEQEMGKLCWKPLLTFPASLQKLLLQAWVKRESHLVLSEAHLERLVQDFLHSGPDKEPLFTLRGWELTRDHDTLIMQSHSLSVAVTP